jgi:hypothetical protein
MDEQQPTARRGTHLTICHRIVIYRPPDEVFERLADGERAREWFARVRLAGGMAAPEPVLTVLYPGRHVAFRDSAATLPTYGDFRISPVPSGTSLEYVLNVELIGAWRLAAGYLRLTGPRRVIWALRALRAELESAPSLVSA